MRVAPVAQAAHVNVLAFTNDSSVAAPGVWPLGISPAQQVQRVMQVANNSGHNEVAALLPDDVFGHSLGAAITATQSAQATQPIAPTTSPAAPAAPAAPRIVYYAGSFSGLNNAVEDVSDFGDRGQNLMVKIKKAQELNTAAGAQQARDLQHQPIPPAALQRLVHRRHRTRGNFAEIATLLPYYSVSTSQVQLLGPALWADLAKAMASKNVYEGALYAAPDPAPLPRLSIRNTKAPMAARRRRSPMWRSTPPPLRSFCPDKAAIACPR